MNSNLPYFEHLESPRILEIKHMNDIFMEKKLQYLVNRKPKLRPFENHSRIRSITRAKVY